MDESAIMNFAQPLLVELTDSVLSNASLWLSLISMLLSIITLAINAYQLFLRPYVVRAGVFMPSAAGRNPFVLYVDLDIYNPSSRSKCVVALDILDADMSFDDSARFGFLHRAQWQALSRDRACLLPLDRDSFDRLRACPSPDGITSARFAPVTGLPFVVPPFDTVSVSLAFACNGDTHLGNVITSKSAPLDEAWADYTNIHSGGDTSLPHGSVPLSLCVATRSILLGSRSCSRPQIVPARGFSSDASDLILPLRYPQ